MKTEKQIIKEINRRVNYFQRKIGKSKKGIEHLLAIADMGAYNSLLAFREWLKHGK